jgi:energy-coupling factor transporter transmembrane protein EcfT
MALGVTWGAPILLIFLWRRLTGKAVWVQVITTLLFIGVIPFVISAVPELRRHPSLIETTRERVVRVESESTQEDVLLGKASKTGEKITKEQRIEPVPLYFEDGLTRLDPSNPDSPKEGIGRFNIEVYLVAILGVNVSNFTPPMILTVRFLVDALLPILILLVASILTRPGDPEKLARFYARLKTPVATTPELDEEAVALSYAKTDRFDHTKLFSGSNWEFTKWDRTDVLGFLSCCVATGVIILIFKGVLLIGA